MTRFAYSLAALLLAPLAGCVMDNSTSSTALVPPAEPPKTSAPQVASVDPGAKLNATGGEGVGVFASYQRGGTWVISWTCDTARSSQPCTFDITASAPELQLESQDLESGTARVSGSELAVSSTTSTGIDSVTLHATPGARLLLGASIGAPLSASIIFFVQDGKVNGGYTGVLSNPIYLEPKSP